MSKILFVNGNAHGHIHPTLALVKELTELGEEVFYFSTEEFREKIEGAGAAFISYSEKLNTFFKKYTPSGSHPFYSLVEFLLKMDEAAIEIVLEKTRDYDFDYMIHDSMFGGGRILSKRLGLPALCSCTSFAMNKLPLPPYMLEPGFHPELDKLYRELERAAEVWKEDSLSILDIFFKKEALNLVYTSRLFQPDSDSFDDSFKFVGPSFIEGDNGKDKALTEHGNTKLIYISLGTINNNYSGFYQTCIEAFAGERINVIMSVGSKIDINSLGRIPDNFVVRSYVPQLEVLKKTDVFISHGGLNSVSEALYYGVPVVAIPLVNDQPAVARQLASRGAGLTLKMEEITPDLLKETVRKMLEEESYRVSSRHIGASFREAGGYKAAVKHIVEYKKRIGL